MRGIFQEKTLQRVLSMPVLLTIYLGSVDGIRILFVSYSIMCPILYILYYITIQYVVFLWFFCFFLYHTQTQNVGGDMYSIGMLRHGEGGGVGVR